MAHDVHAAECLCRSPIDGFLVKWVTKTNGKELAIVNGYTFFFKKKGVQTNIWYCTSGGSCRARLITTNEVTPLERQIVSVKENHTHAPPAFVISNGFYVKI